MTKSETACELLQLTISLLSLKVEQLDVELKQLEPYSQVFASEVTDLRKTRDQIVADIEVFGKFHKLLSPAQPSI